MAFRYNALVEKRCKYFVFAAESLGSKYVIGKKNVKVAFWYNALVEKRCRIFVLRVSIMKSWLVKICHINEGVQGAGEGLHARLP